MKEACLLLLLSVALRMANASENLDSTGRLQVQIPPSFFRDEGYSHREALFGIPNYGGGLSLQAYYADSDFCEDNVDTHKGYPTRPYDANGVMYSWGKHSEEDNGDPFILIVDRGTCNFVTKVRSAQKIGAAAVLIANNKCLCSDAAANLCTNSDSAQCENYTPIMADDGSGSDITIPTFLMFKQDSDLLKASLKQDTYMQIDMKWSLPAPDDRVEWDLWTVPTESSSFELLKTFKNEVVALGQSAQFTPHYNIFDGTELGCIGTPSPCGNLCTNAGRYCAIDPDNDTGAGVSGADVVEEILNRLCIWSHYGSDGIGAQWWDYNTCFINSCFDIDSFNSKDCVEKCYKNAKIDFKVIDQCVRDTGGLSSDVPNSLFDLEITAKQERGLVVLPAVYVNNIVMRGTMKQSTVFNTICAGFLEGTEPEVCAFCETCPTFQLGDCADTFVCGNGSNGGNGNGGGGGVSFGTLFLLIFLTAGGMGGAGYFYHRKTQSEMRDQVRGILSDYMPLEGDTLANGSRSSSSGVAGGGGASLTRTEMSANI